MTCLPEMNSALLREAHVLLHLISGFYHITVAHFSRVVFDPPIQESSHPQLMHCLAPEHLRELIHSSRVCRARGLIETSIHFLRRFSWGNNVNVIKIRFVY